MMRSYHSFAERVSRWIGVWRLEMIVTTLKGFHQHSSILLLSSHHSSWLWTLYPCSHSLGCMTESITETKTLWSAMSLSHCKPESPVLMKSIDGDGCELAHCVEMQ